LLLYFILIQSSNTLIVCFLPRSPKLGYDNNMDHYNRDSHHNIISNNENSTTNTRPTIVMRMMIIIIITILQSYQSHIYNTIFEFSSWYHKISLFFLILLQPLSSKLMLCCHFNHFLFLSLVYFPSPQHLAQLIFSKMNMKYVVDNFFSSKWRAQQAPNTILDSPLVKSLVLLWSLGLLVVLPCLSVPSYFHFHLVLLLLYLLQMKVPYKVLVRGLSS